jgi:hypothetical protein
VPIANAEIAFPELAKSATSDVRGAFRITGIPAGTHHVVIRRLGYGAAETQLQVTGHETIERRVVLGRAVTLETMVVTSQMDARRMAEFEESRRVGLGQFLTRAELQKFDGLPLRTPLQQLRGLGFVSTNAGFFPIKDPGPPATCPQNPITYPPCMRSHGYEYLGGTWACFKAVYVDGVLQNSGIPTPPYDLKEIPVDRAEAIEYYAGGAETPARYAQGASSPCGVIVIWTRQGPDKG